VCCIVLQCVAFCIVVLEVQRSYQIGALDVISELAWSLEHGSCGGKVEKSKGNDDPGRREGAWEM